jgi:hypothetical protein
MELVEGTSMIGKSQRETEIPLDPAEISDQTGSNPVLFTLENFGMLGTERRQNVIGSTAIRTMLSFNPFCLPPCFTPWVHYTLVCFAPPV